MELVHVPGPQLKASQALDASCGVFGVKCSDASPTQINGRVFAKRTVCRPPEMQFHPLAPQDEIVRRLVDDLVEAEFAAVEGQRLVNIERWQDRQDLDAIGMAVGHP
jgi:hypothetical protein